MRLGAGLSSTMSRPSRRFRLIWRKATTRVPRWWRRLRRVTLSGIGGIELRRLAMRDRIGIFSLVTFGCLLLAITGCTSTKPADVALATPPRYDAVAIDREGNIYS